jgi:hypothetical protein
MGGVSQFGSSEMRNVFGREVADTWQPEALEPLPQEKPHPCNEKTQAPPTYGKVWERKLSTIFYNAGATSNSKYLKPAAGGCWVPTDENGVKRYLKMMAEPLAALPLRSPILTDYGRALEWVQCCNHIAYAGPLAGHKAGVHEINGERILVTNSPKLIEPVRGGWVTPDMLIRGLLVEQEQIDVFLTWLKFAIEGVRTGREDRKLGQALFLVGPPRSGKNFIQEKIVTPALGGREKDPYHFLTSEGAHFNAHLLEAEHLKFSDKSCPADGKTRARFQENLKSWIAEGPKLLERKNGHPITVSAFRRITGSLNEGEHHIDVIPYEDKSIADKLIVLKVSKNLLPGYSHERLCKEIQEELPGFINYLLNEYEPPKDLLIDTDGNPYRFGLKPYQHSEITERLVANSKAYQLKEIMLETFKEDTWEGTPTETYQRLREGPLGNQFFGLWRNSKSMGIAFSELAEDCPSGAIQPKKSNGNRIWRFNLKLLREA